MAPPVLAPMPEALDVQTGYTIRVTAIDPITGNTVPGVHITTVVLTASQAGGPVGGPGGSAGQWFIVPGPGA